MVLAFGLVVGLLLADTYVLTPLWEARAADADLREKMEQRRQVDAQTIRLGRAMKARWQEIVEGGMKAHRPEAESQVYRAVFQWARESGLAISEIIPRDRVGSKQHTPQVSFRAVGRGTLRPVSRFLWHMQTAEFPLKIHKTEITCLKPGTTDVTLNVVVEFSTLYSPEAGGGTTASTREGANG